MLRVGIVGLPNSGKSTLFNALLQRQIAEVAEYPFTTIKPNVGVVQVPDHRLSEISKATGIQKTVPAAIEFIDIAGLVKGAHEGEGLGNQFLGHIRDVDVVLHLVRAFHNPNVQHHTDFPDPIKDSEIVTQELKLAEIEKPTIYAINADETDLSDTSVPIEDAIKISAKLEAELSQLSPEDQKAYLKELGIEKTGLEKVILACYEPLNLITFFTIVGRKQVQAWPVKKGTTALEAAGIVHTDMQKGFIKAEGIEWNKLVEAKSWKAAAEKGWIRLESRDYEIKDGDVVEFKFNI
ncbi:MAG: hypothetical protein A2172_02150 [Candidatus Woykebacteria bacterium RBG_13_40_15]|uniref:OBG-type G domain-containing protein n=1 Tax=Candidatus Woykebacteria bacterium RBG_13_40_15 TaxID=1802593 RepID=A0A1G1W675_9BACT|nr:MAG: hypothetical protein A2172_02150 [Candidatus Woykebacteria bacterium RBG_13_40_15]